MPERNDESGKYTEQYSREEFIEAIRELGGTAGTGEIAHEVGCVHDTAYKKLRAMEDDGEVTSRNVGNTLLWSVEER